jgi:adenosylcobinamide-phosphate synthase
MAAAAAVLAGYAADRALGDPARRHPVAGFGAIAAELESRLWRPSRATGAAYAALLVGGTWAATAALRRPLAPHPGATLLFDAAALWATLGGRSLERAANTLADAVEAGELEQARALAPTLVGRDPHALEPDGLCRAAVESVAENTADAVLAPLLWFALGGAPAAAAYRAANTLDAMVGHRNERYVRFGWAAARLDDLLNWPVARAGAALTAALAPSAGGTSRRTWQTVRRDGGSHPSPNAGRMEAAFAGALELRLGGVNHYGDQVERRPSLGSGAAPTPEDVRRAIRLTRVVSHVGALLAAVASARR